jgi:two-component system phosphate regulon sensor histidine kinase PhoR
LLYAGTSALLAAITWIDYVTGYELGLFVFYFIPVGLVAWYGSRNAGLVYSVAAAVCWYFADRFSLHPYSSTILIYWETFMRLVSNFTTAFTLSAIRRHVRRHEDLLHVVSHDLRTPLSAVIGQAQILRRGREEDSFAAARADAILRATTRMNSMIEDLLDSARFESGQLRLELEDFDFAPYVAEFLGRIGPSLEFDRVKVRMPASGAVMVRADPARLERVLLNLLSNALKYCPEGNVRLEVDDRDGWVSITVVDDGPGIRPDDLPHVFTKFYRGRETSSPAGFGLGLYGAKLIVEAHGGHLDAESIPGVETRFRVKLPTPASA